MLDVLVMLLRKLGMTNVRCIVVHVAPKRSEVWKYMKKDLDGSITCSLCNGIIKNSGNTSNLRAHLQSHHPDIKLEIIKDSNTNKAGLKHKMESNENNSTNTQSLQEHGSDESNECSSPKLIKLSQEVEEKSYKLQKTTGSKQFRIDTLFDNQKSFKDGIKANGMLNRILFMIAKDQMPYNCVEKIGFRTVLNYAAPLYKMPCRTTITQKMHEKYECLSNIVKEDLEKVKYVTLTADAWSDTLNNVGYLGVTCHFIHDYELQSINIGVTELDDHHTSDNLKKWLLQIVETWKINIESIVTVVTDNASNIKKAVKETFGEDKFLDCLAHTLNLVPSVLITSTDIKPTLTKVKDIVKFFKQSNNASDKLREVTKDRLIQSVETRWNSDYEMLERFTALSDKVASILLQLPKSPPMLTADDVQIVKELINLLRPFYNATKIVCAEKYVTGSQAIPIIKILERELESTTVTTTIGVSFKSRLLEQFKKRFEHIEKKRGIAIASLLDPRFKKLYFKNKVACAEAINKISNQLRNLHANSLKDDQIIEAFETAEDKTENEDFWSYHQVLLKHNKSQAQQKESANSSEIPEELRYYLNELPISKNSDPLLFWKMYPNRTLADLAIRYLTIVATSVPSERMFSTAGLIMTSNRNRLTPQHFQELLFLNLLPLKYWKL